MSATIIPFPATTRARNKLIHDLWRNSCDEFFRTATKLGYRHVDKEESGLIDILRHVKTEGREIIFHTACSVRERLPKPGFEIERR